MTLNILDQQLIAAIQDGLEFTAKPFVAIAEQLGISEQKVMTRLQQLKDDGTIKRLGVVVRHRELGFKANAMVVWDIPDDKVAEIAQRIASFECVTLCYQRPRRLPEWSYNLFSMIHGKDRESVLQRLDDLVDFLELQDIKHEPLFSTRRFKQRGARYIDANKIISRSLSNVPMPLSTSNEQEQTVETKLAYG
jgi:DNA-binding Lrp family transcriptional regulator